MTGTILVVDDESTILHMIDEVLTSHGYKCDTAQSVDIAIEMIKKNEYDIILADKNMPAQNESSIVGGLGLLEFVRNYDPSIELIIMTGFATIESVIKALQLGAFDYLNKPFSIEELLEKIVVIRRCQTLIDSENISAFYKTFKSNLLQMLANEYHLEIEQQNQIMTFILDKLNNIFNTIKILERIIIQERDSASVTAGFAAELLESIPESSPHRSLVSKIFEQASSQLEITHCGDKQK
ncbi:response regulator [Candidatus Omnitrophota bacterium]